ncbi:MAG: SGNH/GDSL hydrolase family protein [Afipia felis]|nr:SGNH/GDSL hydrolase family protein [Afipia felis]
MYRRGTRLLAAAGLLGVLAGAPCLAAGETSASQPETQPVANAAPAKPGLTGKAIEAARNAASRAGDILTRIPCLPPKGAGAVSASLPRVARKLNAGEPITVVALGSSSTAGYGTTSSTYTYPSRLAEQLRRKYPRARISVINRGMGGQEVPQMVQRLQSSVLDSNPDLVIWQLGTNTVVRGEDSSGVASMVEAGVAKIQATGADVVLIDPQYVPAVTAKKEGANKMVQLIRDVGRLRHVSVFPRFEVMRQWHEDEKLPFESFSISDGLHLNDWGYACFAQLLGDTIIKSVDQARAEPGAERPGSVMSLRPM